MSPAARGLLERLGWRPGERWLVVHVDDLGICDETVEAWASLAAGGGKLSASLLVPGPAFGAAVDWCRRHRSADIGVHLTLTSEHPLLGWGPLQPVAAGEGLGEATGRFPPRREALATVSIGAMRRELEAQLDRARSAGVDVTHLDLHMGCLMTPRRLGLYLELGRRAELPLLLWRPHDWALWDFAPREAASAAERIDRWAVVGRPVFDRVLGLPLDRPRGRRRRLQRIVEDLPEGLTLLYLHPAVDSSFLRRAVGDWRGRVADFELLASGELDLLVAAAGVRRTSYRELGSRQPTPG